MSQCNRSIRSGQSAEKPASEVHFSYDLYNFCAANLLFLSLAARPDQGGSTGRKKRSSFASTVVRVRPEKVCVGQLFRFCFEIRKCLPLLVKPPHVWEPPHSFAERFFALGCLGVVCDRSSGLATAYGPSRPASELGLGHSMCRRQ